MSYLERIFSRPAKLPSLADNVVQLARLTQDEVAGNRRVAMALARDQVMSAKLLRLANAASYGSRGKVDSLEQALTLVGLTDFRVLVLASGALSAMQKVAGLDLAKHWRHGFVTAQIAATLSQALRRPEGYTYVGGLLHTIGVLLVHVADPEKAGEVMQRTDGGSYLDRVQVEREILGTDHAEIGGELLRRWRLPDKLVETIQGYPDAGVDGKSPASIIRLANSAAFDWVSGAEIATIWAAIQEDLGQELGGSESFETCIRDGEAEAASSYVDLERTQP
jgi:HD-like signal output (HDOD) protein